jgi:hypothetical protein
MARRKSISTKASELRVTKVKKQIDALDANEQSNLLHMVLADPCSRCGALVRSMLTAFQQKADYLEQKAGIAPQQIDRGSLTITDETDKEAMKRTRRKSTNAVKTARYKARKKAMKAMLPPFTVEIR